MSDDQEVATSMPVARVQRPQAAPRWVSVAEAAVVLRVSDEAIYRALRRGTLRGRRLNPRGPWRILSTDLEGVP